MSGSPKLEGSNDRDQDVQYQRGWPNGCSYEPEQRHHRDVARRPSVADRRIEKRDNADRQKKKTEMRGVHHIE